MNQDDKRQILFFGDLKEMKQRSLSETVKKSFSKYNLEISWEAYYPNVEYSDARAVVHGDDLEDKSGEWLRDVPAHLTKTILSSTDRPRPTIGGWGLTAEPDRATHWRYAAEKLSLPEVIQYAVTFTSPNKSIPGQSSKSSTSNAPFSYDPAQDYSTEPDR